jgi:dihydroorotase
MNTISIRNATIINERTLFEGNVFVKNGVIWNIDPLGKDRVGDLTIDAQGAYLIPGAIDDQVHFREPGLTHKGELMTESRAAVVGGVTSYMEMPNTVPGAVTAALLEQKYARAAEVSAANYSFFMGTTNDNLAELLKVDYSKVCGVKIFMGSSTGNMLVDDEEELHAVFKHVPALIALHCEDDPMIKQTQLEFIARYGEQGLNASHHPLIRHRDACYASSSKAVALAKQYGTRIHVLHISTAEELALFSNDLPLEQKHITAEACIHHLWFSEEDYAQKGNYIKWNPAVKSASDREAILQAVIDGRIDVVATDHAPHTIEEKEQSYLKAPSGGPLVQHSVQAMFELAEQGKISHAQVVKKMSHDVATLFRIDKRGFIREGYHADLALVKKEAQRVEKRDLWYKCGWSPFEGKTFSHRIISTLVNGHPVWHNGMLDADFRGDRLRFLLKN